MKGMKTKGSISHEPNFHFEQTKLAFLFLRPDDFFFIGSFFPPPTSPTGISCIGKPKPQCVYVTSQCLTVKNKSKYAQMRSPRLHRLTFLSTQFCVNLLSKQAKLCIVEIPPRLYRLNFLGTIRCQNELNYAQLRSTSETDFLDTIHCKLNF